MDKYSALTTLVCVVEQNSFSRAAEQLGKTPSAVAKTIAALEAELGARLFERSTRRIQLTEAGRLYAQAVREALACLGQASEAIGQLQRKLNNENIAKQVEEVKKAGVQVVEKIDPAPFAEATKGVRASFIGKFGGEAELKAIDAVRDAK